MLRQVIVTILGNVDSGKSKTIDCIKKTTIVASEPGQITQSIKAYAIDMDAVKKLCGNLLDITKIKIPGLLFIDTPGHAAFANLRKRGGSLADIAVLVIDLLDGIKPQTLECLEILKENKTPFIIAFNKLDLINGWKTKEECHLLKNFYEQAPTVQNVIEEKLYALVGKLYDNGFQAERFDRIEDFTKNIAIVPISAKTGEGIPELLMMLSGLAQKFLETQLKYDPEAPGEGTILEVTEEKGLGTCLDTIIYKGKIKTGDKVVIGTLGEPIVTKVKAMFIYEKNNLTPVKEVQAAIGIKLNAQDAKDVIPGMPIKTANKDLEKIKIEIKEAVEEITLELDDEGIIIKADTLGSLEALITILHTSNIKIKRASIGDITKKDITEAEASPKRLDKIVLGFGVKGVDTENIKVITHQVIYSLVDLYKEWYEKSKIEEEVKQLKDLIKPCKIKLITGYVFRQSNPAVVGTEVIAGTLRSGTPLMKDGLAITEAKSLQEEGKSVNEAKKGKEVAVAYPGVIVGRQIKENDILYSDIPETQFVQYKKLKEMINDEDKELLKEIADIKRKSNPMWGV